MIELQQVKDIYPFNRLELKDFNRIINLFRVETFRKGKYIYYQGDKVDTLFFLLKGRVSLYKWIDSEKEKLFREVSFGNWMAVSEALLREPYFFDARTGYEVSVLSIPADSIKRLLEYKDIRESIIISMAEWSNFYNRQAVNSTCISALEDFISRSKCDIIEITQEKLSLRLGYTRECINKNLKKLEARGDIKLERSKIVRTGYML